jgi:hypothetical protein
MNDEEFLQTLEELSNPKTDTLARLGIASMSAWDIPYNVARIQDFIAECMENRFENGYLCTDKANRIAIDLCTCCADAEKVPPQLLAPFIEMWQKEVLPKLQEECDHQWVVRFRPWRECERCGARSRSHV